MRLLLMDGAMEWKVFGFHLSPVSLPGAAMGTRNGVQHGALECVDYLAGTAL